MKRTFLIILAMCLIVPLIALGEEEDYICAQPGDSGADVRIVLEAACGIGVLPDLTEDEETYREEYIPAVQSLEAALSLEADGVVYLSELTEIEGAVGKGGKGPYVQELLERLFDLRYISKVLPEPHDLYEPKYESTVKKMEKDLGLKPDGMITGTEWETIRKQRTEKPDGIKNIKGASKDNKAVLTWPAVRGAAYYRIIRNGALMCVLKASDNNQLVDDEISPDGYWSYVIVPYGYYTAGPWSERIRVATAPQIKSIKAKQSYIVVKPGETVNPEDYYTVEPADACKVLAWTMTGGNEYQKAHGLVSAAELENDATRQIVVGYYFSAGVDDEKIKITGKAIDGSNKTVSFSVYVLNSSGSTLFNTYNEQWKSVSGNKLDAKFQVESFKYGKEIRAFEMSVIATDGSGKETRYRVKTETKIAPGKRAWSNTMTISNRNRIKKISWWPSKIWYSDGSTCEDIEGRITMTSENGNIWD